MATYTNRKWVLKTRPVGMVKKSDFDLVEEPTAELQDGQVLVENQLVAFDPAMRGWLDDRPSYVPPVGIGEVMRAATVGRVLESRSPKLAAGDLVTGTLGWQSHPVVDLERPTMFGSASKLPPGATPEQALSIFGITGLTAYFGLLDVGEPKEGDVVLVSGAAGATGSVAAQIARIKGASKVVGIAGGPEKCRWLVEKAGIDAAIDYKNEDVGRRMREECPNGINVFFDNVGGEILNSALVNMANHGRIVLCGGISGYNETKPQPGPSNIMELVIRRCRMEGFIVIDYLSRMSEAVADMAKWAASGDLIAEVDVQEGFENVPDCLLRLFEGRNLGKQLCRIA